ncbi:phage tail tape measure protein [Streptomyces sp. NPDC001139]
MSNLVEILITAKDLAGPALARARADAARLQAEAARQSAAASAASDRRRALEMERERLYAAEQASIARRAAGQTTAAQRAAEREQLALARRSNQQQIAAARTAEREQVASARRASAQVAAAQREQVAGAKATAGKMRGAFEGIALASAVVGVESIKMASKFDASMTLLVTQAGVAKKEMGTLRKGILDLAGKVGQDPDSLAESLFHVESNFESMGISSSKALKLVETAAKGATTGHADLVDVTNALTAAVASGIPGVEDFDKAMGVLNATVGVGDMKMQDLANAFGSGMVATVKGFGLTIQDVGAALAVFGDNNIRGSLAGNQLRMSVMALGKPVSTAKDALDKLGMKTDTLAKDMRKGGLKLALEDLIDRFKKTGITGKEQGQVITDLFGRKAGAGLNVLVDQFDRLKTKYPALEEGAHHFGKSWEDTKKTFAFQTKAMKGELESLGIQLGVKLMPAASKFLGFLTDVSKNDSVKSLLKSMAEEGGAAFDAINGGLKVAAPFLTELAHGFQANLEAITPFLSEIGRVGSAVADALFPAKGGGDLGGPFTRMLAAVRQNKGSFQEMARGFGNAIIDMTEVAVQNLPVITGGFRVMASDALIALGGLVDGAASAFGWMPGIGDKLKNAAKNFDDFRDSAIKGFGKADQSARDLAKGALPRLEKARLKLNIEDWQAQIKTAKSELSKKNLPTERRTYLKGHIKDLESKIATAKRKLSDVHDKTANIKGNAHSFFDIVGQVRAIKIPTKTGAVKANTGGFWAAVRGLTGKVLGTSYINIQKTVTTIAKQFNPFGHAHGGLARGFAGGGDVQAVPDGGYMQGPGTGTSDSITTVLGSGRIVRTSNTEFVVNARETAKHRRLLELINSGQLPKFAKGGLTSGEKDARKKLSGEFGISYFGRLAGYQRTLFEKSIGAPQDMSSLVSALNELKGEIKGAFRGRTESGLLKHLNSIGKALIGHEKALAKTTASLEKAKTKLDDLKSSASQLSDSVKSGILSSANITSGTTEGGPVTVSSIMGGLTQSRDKATALSGALKQLKAKGLSASLLQQIAEAGISGGGLETAGALLGASGSEIQSINHMQGQISKAAGSAGKTTSDSVYGAAIKAQTATVKTLTHSQDRLRKAMENLAKQMEHLLKKAMGKKAAGGIVGAAASGGLRSGLTMVGEQGFELLDLPAGSRVWSNPDSRRKLAAAQAPWASMLNSPRRAPAFAAAGLVPAAGHGQPLVIQLQIGNRQFGELWVDTGRREVRARGGIEATLRPPRGR